MQGLWFSLISKESLTGIIRFGLPLYKVPFN